MSESLTIEDLERLSDELRMVDASERVERLLGAAADLLDEAFELFCEQEVKTARIEARL